jgi:hypothetical protein
MTMASVERGNIVMAVFHREPRPCLDVMAGDLNPDRLQHAIRNAANSEPLILPALTSTEAEPKFVLMYAHMRQTQIAPSVLNEMCDEDLEYLAAHLSPSPASRTPSGRKWLPTPPAHCASCNVGTCWKLLGGPAFVGTLVGGLAGLLLALLIVFVSR